MAINIRSGGSAAAQQQFKASVEAVLAQVRRTCTGKLVLDRLNAAS